MNKPELVEVWQYKLTSLTINIQSQLQTTYNVLFYGLSQIIGNIWRRKIFNLLEVEFSHHLRNQYFQVPIIGDSLGGNPFILKDMMPVKESFTLKIISFIVQYVNFIISNSSGSTHPCPNHRHIISLLFS